MSSKIFFSVLVAVLVAQTLADPALCPNPEDANQLVYKQNVRESAPEFGRIEKDYYIPPLESDITCITLSGSETGSVASIGIAHNGINIKLVSDIQHGFDAVLDVYTK